MRIGELAELTDVYVETVRYYEKAGLLPLPARELNGCRSYGKTHLERLACIRRCRALDMPLAGINRLLNFVDHPTMDCGDIRVLVDEPIGRVKARLKSMRTLEQQLTALRRQCGKPHSTKECGILHELVSAAHGEACACYAAS